MELNIMMSLIVLLAAGFTSIYVARLLKLPSAIVLILAGMWFQLLENQGSVILSIPSEGLIAAAVTGLVFTGIDHAVQLNIKQWSSKSHEIFVFSLTRIFIAIVVFAVAGIAFGVSIPISIILALIVSAGAPELYNRLQHKHILTILYDDAAVSACLCIAAAFLFLTGTNITSGALALKWAIGFFAAVGTGIFLAILFYRLLTLAAEEWARIALFIIGILAFFIADQLYTGMGAIAILSLGFFFANVSIKHDLVHGPWLGRIIQLFVFILLGLIIPLHKGVILTSIGFVLLLIISRYIAARIVLQRDFTGAHKKIIGLKLPLGLPAAAIALLIGVTAPQLLPSLSVVPLIMLVTLAVHALVGSSHD